MIYPGYMDCIKESIKMSPQPDAVDMCMRLFKHVVHITVRIAANTNEGEPVKTKDEILQYIKSNFWNIFDTIQRNAQGITAGDIFARFTELRERLHKNYPYENEDAEELLNVWAYEEAKELI